MIGDAAVIAEVLNADSSCVHWGQEANWLPRGKVLYWFPQRVPRYHP